MFDVMKDNNPWVVGLLCLMAVEFVIQWGVDWLDLKAFERGKKDFSAKYPEFLEWSATDKYQKAFAYQREGMWFSGVRRTVFLVFFILFWLWDGFGVLDLFVRSISLVSWLQGLVFIGVLSMLRLFLQLPFSCYHTFVIEERFGFNRTTLNTFVLDLLKSLLLGVILGGLAWWMIQFFFEKSGEWAWLWAWVGLSVFQLVVAFLAPAVLMPFFNRFVPLPEGELKRSVNEYMQKTGFKLQGIYLMDGSKRSSKANAFFTGFGKLRKLVLFDTLIEKHTCEELVAILAHEVGHYKMRHIPIQLILSIGVSGIIFYLLSFFLLNENLCLAFGVRVASVYSSLVFAMFYLGPLMRFAGVLLNALSRKFEFAADRFSVDTFGSAKALAESLVKLSVDHLSNMTPHPLKVFWEYSHPPVLERVIRLKSYNVK